MRRSLTAALLATTLALAVTQGAAAAPGELDTSFSGDGKLTVDFGGKTGSITDVAVQPDGKLVLVGWQFTNPGEPDFVVMRVNADGTPDGGFQSGGTVVLDVLNNTQRTWNVANTVALQPDGKILVGGNTQAIGATLVRTVGGAPLPQRDAGHSFLAWRQ